VQGRAGRLLRLPLVGGCECREGPGDYYASRWSAVDGIDRWPKNLPKKEKLEAYRASRWSAV